MFYFLFFFLAQVKTPWYNIQKIMFELHRYVFFIPGKESVSNRSVKGENTNFIYFVYLFSIIEHLG